MSSDDLFDDEPFTPSATAAAAVAVRRLEARSDLYQSFLAAVDASRGDKSREEHLAERGRRSWVTAA